ncbi:hypothetical protein [Rhodococcus ruber]|uniref:hypothetical protein n=1 Tax=Rhodococcus ruber TaxID=1830 RepID=UPI000F548AFC|nr:hypothetical protein [Rhodococcus ruber]MDO1481785.1 hypothetical protein [Rhodococcus ruber]RQM31535.1 hypothetical protein TN91_25770 [Rhodococcus ruber]
MADNDQKRRFLRNRGRSAHPTDASIPPSSETAAPAGAQTVPQRRPARAQATQDVVDLVGFLRAAENRRAQGRPAPTPKSMRDVLGAFRGQPAQQTTTQVLAAAATTRHLGAQSQNTRRWEQLAQENAARLEALRAQQYHQEQQRYVQVQMPPEEIQRRMAEKEAADRDSDNRAFDAAAALALNYVAARSVPSFDKLAELSEQHLSVVEPTAEVPESVTESSARTADEQTTTAGAAAEMNVDESANGPEASSDTDPQTDMAAAVEEAEEADVSDQLEHVSQAAQKNGADLDKIGSVLESAGRGLATAIGPVNGDDEVAPPLSPVDLSQLSQELLSAIGAAMSSHPRSVTEMLNIERRPDHTNEAAFVPDMGVEHSQEATLGY